MNTELRDHSPSVSVEGNLYFREKTATSIVPCGRTAHFRSLSRYKETTAVSRMGESKPEISGERFNGEALSFKAMMSGIVQKPSILLFSKVGPLSPAQLVG